MQSHIGCAIHRIRLKYLGAQNIYFAYSLFNPANRALPLLTGHIVPLLKDLKYICLQPVAQDRGSTLRY